ncbi:hypothetical protein LQ939_02570 [Pantoea alhagi]|nr:hypothetical protein [Pantoea alhagi]URQ61272.1 hypothetical protein LQ939_02570 [Pantoea alhagi]
MQLSHKTAIAQSRLNAGGAPVSFRQRPIVKKPLIAGAFFSSLIRHA